MRRVRQARARDRHALRHLQSSLPEPSPPLLDYACAAGHVLVASVDSTLVGYLLFVPGESGAHVAEVVVASRARRDGHATALFEALFDRVDGPVSLAVSPANDAALALYRSLGFRVVDRDEFGFDDGPALSLER